MTNRSARKSLALQFDIEGVEGGLADVLDRMRLALPEKAFAGFRCPVGRFAFRIGEFDRTAGDNIKNVVRMGMHWHFLPRLNNDIEDTHAVIVQQHFVHLRRNLDQSCALALPARRKQAPTRVITTVDILMSRSVRLPIRR
jgi:hypothetical protein